MGPAEVRSMVADVVETTTGFVTYTHAPLSFVPPAAVITLTSWVPHCWTLAVSIVLGPDLEAALDYVDPRKALITALNGQHGVSVRRARPRGFDFRSHFEFGAELTVEVLA